MLKNIISIWNQIDILVTQKFPFDDAVNPKKQKLHSYLMYKEKPKCFITI